MTDQTLPEPDGATDVGSPEHEAAIELRQQLASTRKEMRQLEVRLQAHGDRVRDVLRVALLSTSFLAAGAMLFGSLMKFFVPVSGDDRSLTLYQVLDPERNPDLLDEDSDWGTGAGWYIPIAMLLICAVLVVSMAVTIHPATRSRVLITVTEVFCWCLSVGCVLGFTVLADLSNVVGVPGGLMTILLGGVLGIVSCRIARAYLD